jgi:hypothetical protein
MTKARDLANASTALSAVSATELGYLDGVTSAVQTQLNAKQPTVSGVDDTEIGYLNGVTSAIQTQIDTKLSSATAATTYAPLNLVTSAQTASYTLVLADAGDLVEVSNASANNLTVPLNSSVAFPVGTQINILQTGAGQTTVVATGGVTINATPGLKLRAQWSSATLIKRAENTWVLVGDLSA